MRTKRLAILFIGALLLSYRGLAAEFTVDSTIDDIDAIPGDGVCKTATGLCTLRAAIQETNALNGADTINLPSGTYQLTRPGDISEYFGTALEQEQQLTEENGDLDIIDDLTIRGGGPEGTVIDASPIQSAAINARVLHIARSARVELRGLLIRGGADTAGGGGIFNVGALTLRSVAVSDNHALISVLFRGAGGGIYNKGNLTLDQTSVHHNTATLSGGGIYNQGGNIFMSGGALYSNRAKGGGISTARGSGRGGGLLSEAGTINLTGVTIAWNQVDLFFGEPSGAGILNIEGSLTMDNSTLSDNYVSELRDWVVHVAEIENHDEMTLNNATIGEMGLRNEGRVQLRNTLIGGTCTGTIQSLGYNLLSDASGCTLLGDSTGDLIGVDPRLGPLQNNGGPTETRALLPASPAIDAGDPASCEATDQRGISRPLDGDLDGQAICDIGAYEADGSEQERPWLAAAPCFPEAVRSW